jgi:hypothetical protein
MKKTVAVLFAFLCIFSCSNNDVSSVTAPNVERTALTSGSWAKGLTGYTFYMDGGVATTIFTSPISASITTSKITSVRWVWNQPPRGTVDVVLQYTPLYGSTPTKFLNVSGQQNGTTTAFNNENARGQISLKFTSYNGAPYPLTRTLKDSIIERYTY